MPHFIGQNVLRINVEGHRVLYFEEKSIRLKESDHQIGKLFLGSFSTETTFLKSVEATICCVKDQKKFKEIQSFVI